jgi:glycerol-3-phosphate acyltransferase PlsX
MGNDNSPEALGAVLRNLHLPENVDLVLFGLPEYQKLGTDHYVATPEFIEMDESPLYALRRKKKASMCEGLRLLKAKKLDAFISAGNTGAFVSAAKMILGNIPGILRPALLARMPTKKLPVTVLDVGASIQCKAAHLVQFAKMGAAYCKIHGIDNPTVGLLNIGSEPIKGTSELRLAYQELQKPHTEFRFAGNIEGKSVFEGDVDVLVTDGFTGNVFLKTGEGIASLILDRFGGLIPPGEYKKLHPQIQDLASTLHYAEHPGALLAGVRGIVIKCHGYSTPGAFDKAILGAIDLVQGNFSEIIERQLRHKTPTTITRGRA